jgi:hypothetical protein
MKGVFDREEDEPLKLTYPTTTHPQYIAIPYKLDNNNKLTCCHTLGPIMRTVSSWRWNKR